MPNAHFHFLSRQHQRPLLSASRISLSVGRTLKRFMLITHLLALLASLALLEAQAQSPTMMTAMSSSSSSSSSSSRAGLTISLASSDASSGQCAPLSTLSFDCKAECGASRPCIRYQSLEECRQFTGGAGETKTLSSCVDQAVNVSSTNSSSCGVECFKTSDKDSSAVATATSNISATETNLTNFTFFIPFSLKSLGGRPVENATGGFPAKSEDALKKIAILDFPDTVTDFVIAGGTNSTGGVKGRVVEVTLANWILNTKVNLRAVTFANINVTLLPSEMFPMTIVNLTLTNLYLESLPSDLPGMTTLQRLNLTQNNLSKFPTKFGMDSLQALDVSSNNLDKFDAVSPNLEYLDLSDNVLDALPATIFQMEKLQYLNLKANAFSGVVLTSTQFDFLKGIPTLIVDSFGSLSCPTASQQELGGATVCVDASISTTASHEKGSSSSAGLIGGVVGAVVLVAFIIGFVFWMRRRRNAAGDEKPTDYSESLGTGFVKQSSFVSSGTNYTNLGSSSSRRSLWGDQELASLQVRCEDIEDIERIGSGAFGVVWLAKYRQTQLVASKRLKRDEVTWQRTQDFVAEIKLVSKMDHACILPLIGVAWTIESDLQALFEYMENGDLRSYLVTNTEDFRGVWTAEKLNIAINVADALVYLHSFSPPLVHRDLKSRNVLLGKDMEAKVSDFGVSRFQSEQATMTAGVGTGRWLAPEVISGNNDYDQSCDIFALGVVLSEMDTHELPYEKARGPMDNELNEVAVLQMVAAGTLKPSFTAACPPKIFELAEKCLSFDRSKRPSAFQITKKEELRSKSTPSPSNSSLNMFMLKKKKAPVDTSKQIKAIAWDLSKIAIVFVGIRAASVFLNKDA